MAISDYKLSLIQASFERSEMLHFFNATLEAVDKGFISIKMPKQAFMTRKAGMFNGAIIAALVDASSGYAAVSAKEDDCYVVTIELKVLSKSYVVKNGSKVSVIRTEIYCISGNTEQHVATSLVSMMRIK